MRVPCWFHLFLHLNSEGLMRCKPHIWTNTYKYWLWAFNGNVFLSHLHSPLHCTLFQFAHTKMDQIVSTHKCELPVLHSSETKKKKSKGNLLLLYEKALGSTKVISLENAQRLWADLKNAGRMFFQCTYNNRWCRSGRRNTHSASKWQQDLLLQQEVSTATEVCVLKSQRGAQDWADKRL